jgi:hypothetical protein
LNFDTIARRFFLYWPIEPEARCRAFRDHGVLVFLSFKDNILGVRVEGNWGNVKARERLQEKLTRQLIMAIQAQKMAQGFLDVIQIVRQSARGITFPKPSAVPQTPPAKPAVTPE